MRNSLRVTSYDVSLEVIPATPKIDVPALVALAQRVMTDEQVAEATALAIVVIDDEEMRALNRQFLGIDSTTDVLSFPDDASEFVGDVGGAFLGDIAISLPTAERQATSAGHEIDAEMGHLLVHGILHLCGYDHEVGGEEEARMRAREEYYLGGLGHVHSH